MNEKLLEIIKKNLTFDVQIAEESRLREDLGLTSLNMIVIVCELEDTMKIALNYLTLGRVKTVGDLNKVIEEELHGK